MPESKEGLKILECKASDHEYLHKDFHGALCYAIRYLDENYGLEATTEYLRQVGRSYYAPLSQQLRNEGLAGLERHWNTVFTKEGGKFTLSCEGGVLVLTVHECPAIAHLKKIDQLFTDRYCQTTVVVNDTISRDAGYCCSTEYEPGAGKCVQRFWKAKE